MNDFSVNRVHQLISELRAMRDEISDYTLSTSAKQVELAAWLLDPMLLEELEITASFVRKLDLHHSMLRQSKASSTVRDTVESYKLRKVVEQLQSARATLQSAEPADGSTEQPPRVLASIEGLTEKTYQDTIEQG